MLANGVREQIGVNFFFICNLCVLAHNLGQSRFSCLPAILCDVREERPRQVSATLQLANVIQGPKDDRESLEKSLDLAWPDAGKGLRKRV